jgi:esterase/lipase superfamily enzyme
MRSIVRHVAILCCLLSAAGCVGSREHYLLNPETVAIAADEIAATHEIYVATTRSRSSDPRKVFTGERSLASSFAKVEVTVPKIHAIGNIERAKGSAPSDPAKHFTATKITEYEGAAQFGKDIGLDIARSGDRVLVFVHGYNTGFDDGIYRITQIDHDTKYPGTPVLFSWASGARTRDYVYDRDSANVARDELEALLRLLAKSKAESIDIIAHSMGTWLTMETLRQLAISGDRDLGGKLGYVVLASPDIDVDVFKKQMQRYGRPDRPFAILLSQDDRALKISSVISGDRPRLGQYTDAAELAKLGVAVVDISKTASGDRLNHAKFADNPVLVQLLGNRLQTPASLASADPSSSQLNAVGESLGKTVGSVAEIIITTPFKVLTLGTGG